MTLPKPLTVWITKKLWKNLQEIGIPDYLTCFLRHLYAGQEATVRIGHGTIDWFQIGKGVHQRVQKEYIKAIYRQPAYFAYMQGGSCEMPG